MFAIAKFLLKKVLVQLDILDNVNSYMFAIAKFLLKKVLVQLDILDNVNSFLD